jgi:hypothetical protein
MPLGRDRRQRRRRAAAIGGAAYAAGKHRANQQQAEQQQQPPAAPQQADTGEPAERRGLTSEAMNKLQQLADLHAQNVLSDEEFEREKAKLLGG